MTELNPAPARERARLLTWGRTALGVVWLVSLVVAAQAGVFLVENRTAILRRLGLLETTGVLQTNLYAVGFQRVPIAIDGRYGAITPLSDGVLFASRSGRLWFVDSMRAPRELGLRVPINVSEFESDPYNDATVDKDHFAVKDLLMQRTTRGVRLLASHHQWDSDRDCNVLRVSMIEIPLDSLLAGGGGAWETLFDTRPCLELGLRGEGQRVPTIGAGGRLESLSDREILLTVGIFIGDATSISIPASSRDPASDYGKTIAIDLLSRRSRVFTQGHRNAQGLAVGLDSRIWLTEHALRGGDELNLLREGRDYGYPYVSYGTTYETLEWPLNLPPGQREAYEKPVYAWVPSIAPSQLLVVKGTAFARWRGDLLVSSLAARSVFRLRLEGDRVVLAEPMQTTHRIRDIIETARGEVVLLAEDGFLVYLEPLVAGTEDPNLSPRERGQLVASRCQGCHALEEGGANRVGPNLFGVVGRRVASSNGFAYSQALRSVSGRWTEATLRRYVADPAGYAPGTSMEFAFELSERDLGYLITYLRTLR